MKHKIFTSIFSLEKLLPLVFGAAVFVFFGFYYPFHLNYQEQFQLFLFSSEYFLGYIGRPGGVADYLGTFLTQFYFYSKIGALVLAIMLVVLQQLVYKIGLKLGAKMHWVPLSFIPSVLYWSLLCNENYLLGGLVAMLLLACFCTFYLYLKKGTIQTVVGLVLLVVLYWMAGGVHVFFALFVLSLKFFERTKPGKQDLGRAIGVMVITLLLPFLAKYLVLQYPMMKFWIGTTYFRFPVNAPIAATLIGSLIFILPLLMAVLSTQLNEKRKTILISLQLVVLIGFGSVIIHKSADFSKEEVMAYDFYIRMRKWDRAIAMADKKHPTSPLSVACLNLALAKQDLLGERMFSYYQKGMGGLIPDFKRDFTIPIMAGEVYYHLGLINTAQRFAFEAMEALPDYQKSARTVKRLAETNIINGEYKLARKYLHLLQKTMYYKAWATQALQIMTDEEQVESHIEWGWLRKARIQKDFLFSEQEKENMLGQLFTHNNKNRMAFEYLLTSSLVKKDLQQFINYFALSNSLNYKHIPKNFQEALVYIWEVTNKDKNREIPYPINANVRARLTDYKKLYGQTRDAQKIQRNHGNTYWYYYHFRN